MKNLFMPDLTHDYYVEIARQLTEMGHSIRAIGAGKSPEYWPSMLNEFIEVEKPTVTRWDDFNVPEQFEKVLDPDYSLLNSRVFTELAYYEKMFLLSTDRLAFVPISQIDRSRLFYRFIGHFYKILKKENIDGVVFFGTPHGLWSIALFGLAKAMDLKTLYVDWVALSPDLSTIETELHIRRSYSRKQMELGREANGDESKQIHDVVARTVNAKFVWTATKHISLPKVYLRAIASLVLRNPFGAYISPEFFLNPGHRTRITYIPYLLKYFVRVGQMLRYYENHSSEAMPDKESLVLFLAHQPEAATMPLGGEFADQLLVLDLILQAVPKNVKVFVKEHPFMFGHSVDIGQDRHERSVAYYRHMLKDSRVRFVKRTVSSSELVEKAGYVASIGGSISWEAMRAGKPCIIFGWSWYAGCKSCFSVDSVETLKSAFREALAKDRAAVLEDVRDFLATFEKRLILAPSCRSALYYLGNDYPIRKSVKNLARAIDISLTESAATVGDAQSRVTLEEILDPIAQQLLTRETDHGHH